MPDQNLKDMDALRSSEAFFRLLAERAGDVISRHRFADRGDTYLSPAVERLLGWTAAEVIESGFKAFYHPDDRQAVSAAVAAMLSGPPELSVQYRGRAKDGRYVWLESHLRLVRDEAGEPLEVVAVTRDIDARLRLEEEARQAREAARETESRFQSLATTTRDIVIEVDRRGLILFVSAAVEPVLGYAPSELLGRKAAHLTHPEDLPGLVGGFGRGLRDRAAAPEVLEARALHKDGRWIWLQGRPVIDREAGRIHGVVRDITDYKQSQDRLAAERDRAERALEARSAFLANMSHELRTPLTAVIGFAALVEGVAGLPDEARDYVARISTAGKSLLSVINDVLELSKLETGQVETHLAPCALAPLIDDTVKMFALHAAEKSLDLRIRMIEAPPRVLMIDPDRVRQVLINLIGNAIRYTDVGSVTIEVIWRAELAELFVAVKDTGIGIDPEGQAQLFKRFSQVEASRSRSRGGAGLGLVISKGLVEAMGGRIGASSRPGEGSSFWFAIPAQAPLREEQSDGEAAPVFEPVRAGGRILVVDDNALNREMTRAILGVFDAEVAEARDGREAVDAAMVQPFDLILMDIRMPVMDGLEAARAIRDRVGPNQGAPILAFSADMDFQVSEAFDGLVRKPVTAAQLIQAVAGAARAPRTAA